MSIQTPLLSLLAVAAIALASGDRPNNLPVDFHCENAEAFTVKEVALSSCGLMLVSDSDSSLVLEPTNLVNYLSTAHDGQQVFVTYEVLQHASICMMGHVVEITCLNKR